jgi:hypothetical protein
MILTNKYLRPCDHCRTDGLEPVGEADEPGQRRVVCGECAGLGYEPNHEGEQVLELLGLMGFLTRGSDDER